ncbi:glutathione-dependent formaldehyde-activating enzyme [Hypomontagnella monticulosa]|nr:glutathione-dependent formaldehyde-activating enzyme [Hypomontagnella monticulosa]
MTEELKTYRGNCHCAAYIYEFKAPENIKPSECNCSSCYKKGAYWYVPKNENIRWVKGDINTLTDYTFGEKTFHHKFCPTCGVQLWAGGYINPPQPGEEPMNGFNVRTLQYGQVDVWKVEKQPVDGKSFRNPYKIPKFTGPEPKAVIEGGKLYTGSCHCGAVRVALKSKPINDKAPELVADCNCSICNKLGVVWYYPQTEQVVVEGEDNLSFYSFNKHWFAKGFCKTCGITIHNVAQPVLEGQIDHMSEEERKFFVPALKMTPLNLRILNDLNVKDLTIHHIDGYHEHKPLYVEP